MKRNFMLAGVLALLAAPATFAQTFVDGDFLEGDWVMTLFTKGRGGMSNMTQEPLGGNPGAFASIRNEVFDGGTVTGQILAVYLKPSATWDPNVRGRVVGLTFRQDTKLIEGSGVGQGGALVLYQDGRFFVSNNFDTPETEWTTKSSPGLLTAFDFRMVDPLGGEFPPVSTHPDFGRMAERITFGFARSNSQSGGGAGTIQIVGTDNWIVEIIAGVNPVTVETTRGTYLSGDVSSLTDYDGDFYQVQNRIPFLIAANAEIEATGNVAHIDPSTLTITVTANVTALPINQRIELYNYDTARWEIVDTRPAKVTDETVTIDVATNPGRFVNDPDGQVKARVGYYDQGALIPGWRARIDQVLWSYPG